MSEISVKIFRFNPTVDKVPHYDTYTILLKEPMTIRTILRYLRRHKDPSISFRDFICYMGVCATCMVNVNGSPVRGCSTRVNPGENITIDPLLKHPIVKDLVVDFGTTIQGEDVTYIMKKGTVIEIVRRAESG